MRVTKFKCLNKTYGKGENSGKLLLYNIHIDNLGILEEDRKW
jgi:hypothetical protein